MINKVHKILFFTIILSTLMVGYVFAENLTMNIFYGINNVAKNGNQLPLEVRIQNKDEQDFKGYALINVYESNKSVYVYNADVEIQKKSEGYINKSISINNRANTIIVELYNQKEELIANERTNIDLSYFDDTMIIGALSSDFDSLSYLDGALVYNGTLRIKLVKLTDEMYERNRNLLDQVDVLMLSDIDSSKFSESLNFAIYNFVTSGKPIMIGLGGKNGIYTLPNRFYEYISGPTIESVSANKKITIFDLIGGKIAKTIEGDVSVKYVKDSLNLIICSMMSFNDLKNYPDNAKIVSEIIENSFGKTRLDKFLSTTHPYLANDYDNVNNLLNIIDKMKLPDIFIISIMLVFYISFLVIIIYVYLRNVNKRSLYGRYAIVFSVMYTVIMLIFGIRVMKKNTFLTYMSIVDIKDENTKEKAFLNFRTSERGSYSFNTSSNNKIYPIVKTNNEAILSTNFMDMNSIKKTSFTQDKNRTIIDVDNANDFDSNAFVYENNNYLNDIYNIDCSVSRFSGDVTGRITNNMDVKISDASILMYGKVLKIGDIEPNHSVSLSRAIKYGVPIGNNFMLSEILCDDTNQNLLKYYLDENVYEYFNDALFFGFIDNNGTIDINSNDVGDVYGKTLLIRKIIPDNKENVYDICSLNQDVNNIDGYYEYMNNSINGDTDVTNEYSFEKEYLISSIYLEEISSYDQGKLDYNVPFYGDMFVYNLYTGNFDPLYENVITYENLPKYLTVENKIIFRFSPSSRDPLYRKICLPMIRAIGSK